MYALKEYKASDLPSLDAAIQKGLQLAEKIETKWTASDNYDGVQTYTHWVPNDAGSSDFWAARVSYHNNFTYTELYDTVFKNHTENEAEYIGMVQSFRELDAEKSYLSRLVHYSFPFPLSNRDMVIWLGQKETEAGTQFVNVTFPREFNTEQTKAVYVSVEVVTKLPDGRTKWVMGTASDAGGLVPKFVQRPQMSKAVSEDIPQFTRWLKKTDI